MRSAVAGAMFAMLVACGGNVVVDEPNAAGGAGGASATTSATTTSTTVTTGTTSTITLTTCGTTGCSQTSTGSCACNAACNGQALLVDCKATLSGESCTCIENGIKIANCFDTPALACDPFQGCCAKAFFGL